MNTYSKKICAIIFSFVFIFLTFVPYVAAVDNKITEVNITVPAPTVGDEIPFHDTITIDNKNCRMGTIGWIAEKNGVETFAKSEVFLPDFNYSLLLDLKAADENCIFADNCKVTVNGNSANYSVDSSGNFIVVEYYFGIPESSSDSNMSLLEIIKGYIEEIFARISKIFNSIFGFRLY